MAQGNAAQIRDCPRNRDSIWDLGFKEKNPQSEISNLKSKQSGTLSGLFITKTTSALGGKGEI